MPASRDGVPAVGDLFAGRYRIVDVLQDHARSLVVGARDGDGASVVIRFPRDPSEPLAIQHARCAREAEILDRLSHLTGRVPALVDRGQAPYGPFIVMSRLAGRPASALVLEDGPLKPWVAVALLAEIAAILDEAHSHGVVHRDVKPKNVLVDDSRVALIDWEIAFAYDQDRATQIGAIIGTQGYMPPEAHSGAPPSAATDRYALAVTAYALMCGRAPWPAKLDGTDLLRAQLNGPRLRTRSPRGMSAALAAAFERALDPDPHGRYPSAGGFVAALAVALSEAHAPAPERTGEEPTRRLFTSPRTLVQPLRRAPTSRPPPTVTRTAVVGMLPPPRRRRPLTRLASGGLGAIAGAVLAVVVTALAQSRLSGTDLDESVAWLAGDARAALGVLRAMAAGLAGMIVIGLLLPSLWRARTAIVLTFVTTSSALLSLAGGGVTGHTADAAARRPPGPPGGWTSDEVGLRALVPTTIRSRCRRAKRWEGARATLFCVIGDEAGVTYARYGSYFVLDREYDRHLRDVLAQGAWLHGIGSRCSDDDFAISRWGEGGQTRGKMFCLSTPRRTFVEWAHDAALVLSRAERADGDRDALYRFWRRAGPL